jgi:hypothetical protein
VNGNNIINTPRLNYPLIRSRAASLGLGDRSLTQLLGVRLEELEEDLDQRFISLNLLVRLARTLDLALDELVIVDGPDPDPAEADTGDDGMVLALAATYSGITIDRVLALLRWSDRRLAAAIESIHGSLQETPLRLLVTDSRLSLGLRGGLPDGTRERLDFEQRQREPLHPRDATDLLALVIRKILEPFPDEDGIHDLPELRALHLTSIGLAAPTNPHTIRSSDIEPHPDVLFALRLAAEPDTDPDSQMPWTAFF